jgi:hypothetical protein
MGSLFQWEWLLIEGLVLGLAIVELVALRRSQRRDREAAAAREREAGTTAR